MRNRLLASIMALSLLLVAVGCSGPKPEATVKTFMEAMVKADYEAALQHTEGGGTDTDKVFNPDGEEAERLVKAMFSRLSYKLGESKVSGETATVSLSVTAPNMKTITASVLGEMFGAAFALAFSDDGSSEEMMNEMWITSFESKIGDTNAPMVTNDVTVNLTKSNGKWLIRMDTALGDALSGNMITAFESFDLDK